MTLYIQIENGQPVNHPAFEENLIDAFGEIPNTWELFVRLERPSLNEFQKFDNPAITYEKVNGIWTDVFHVSEMTAEEKENIHQEKIAEYKTIWAKLPQRDNFSAWIFNPETIKYEPPIERPTDREVIWHGASNAWVDKPQRPDDGKEYKLDFYTSSWVEVQNG